MRYLVVALGMMLAGCGLKLKEQTPQPDKVTEVVSKTSQDDKSEVRLQIKDHDGILALIAGHKGKVVVMDGWSTSCAPCVKEFPHLVELHKKYGPEKLACVSLSFDYEGIGKPEEVMGPVLEFLNQQGATFDNLLSSDDSETLSKKLKIPSIPVVFVYDQQGNLAQRFDGAGNDGKPFSYANVEAKIQELLAK